MITDECKKFLTWLESSSPDDSSASVPRHAQTCASCQSVLDDLNAIHAAARSWEGAEAEPPARIWTSLRAQLEKEGLIHTTELERAPQIVSSPGWFERLFGAFPRPVLAGAYLSLLVAAGFALSGPLNHPSNEARWLEGTQIATSPLSAQLNSFEQNSLAPRRPLNPVVTASLQQNLAVVDNYISLCEKSVQEEPQNEVARDYLYEAYQQKADLLAQISERGENVQ